MGPRWRTSTSRFAASAVIVTAALGAAAALPLSSIAAPSLHQLSSQLGQQKARQQSLQASVSGLSQLIGSLGSQIALVQSREAAVNADLANDRAALAAAQAAVEREQRLLVVLRARLARARSLLARQLISSYEADRPDVVSVVLESHGFSDLLERVAYLRDAEKQQQGIIRFTRDARARANAAARRLSSLEESDRQITEATAVRARALTGMDELMQSKQAALQDARAAQQAALQASVDKGQRLRSEISHIKAQQAAAQQAAAQSTRTSSASSSVVSSGASGGWAIPNSIVQCESGGQNLPPNGAGASGYYQIIPSTWKSFGGGGPSAYLAPKSEQDAVARRIWNGGAGASDWDCAAMVGIR
jgi:septal ring factor EnvC (AmiA/AmiB activator)